MSMKIIISVHTEPGFSTSSGIMWKHDYRGFLYGIKNMLNTSEKFNLRVSFFLMPCFLMFKETTTILEILDEIKKEHEIGLHIHPDDKYLVTKKISDGKFKALWFYDYKKQKEMIEFSKKKLEKELNIKIQSFVSGKWSENNNTIKALIKLGFTHDCSANKFKSENCDWSKIGRFRTSYNPKENDYQKIGNLPIVIIPVSKTITNSPVSPEIIDKLGFNILKNTFKEYFNIKFPIFHITLHSPSLTDYGGNPTKYAKVLENLLDYIADISNHNVKFVKATELKAYNKEWRIPRWKSIYHYKGSLLRFWRLR